VDELKRKTEKTKRKFEEFKIQQQEEYNKLHEDIYMRISCVSALLLVTLNRQLSWLDAVNICGLMCVLVCWFDVVNYQRVAAHV
jgi:hypothetical protein